MRIVVLFLSLLFTLSAYEQTSDSKNVYISSTHFKVIVGVSYANYSPVINLAQKYLDIAETVWNKEIVELAFKAPKNSQIKKIDIYMANRSAYNYETNENVTIASNLAGYATEYPSDNTPFFVLNSEMSENIVKVTIAHEFFHTIQYAYFDASSIADTLWYKDIWWIEATAVLMEDAVYDSVNDYTHFLSPFFSASYKSFEIYDGSHEYAMVIFAKYLKEKYGFECIKKSFLSFHTNANRSAFQIVDTLLKTDYNSSMQSALNEFTKWVAEPAKYFEEGNLYPSLKHFKSSDNIVFGKGGVAVMDTLQSGWNMVTLTTIDKDVNASSNDTLPLVWSYESGVWKNSVQHQIQETNSSKGYWVKVDKPSALNYTYSDSSNNDIANLDTSWHLLGTTNSLTLESSFTNSKVLVWQYQEGTWFVYSNIQEIQTELETLNFPQMTQLDSYSAYWLKKH